VAIGFHTGPRGVIGFLLNLTGQGPTDPSPVARSGVIPATTLVDSSGNEITTLGGGGASTVADGANVVEGATTDAVVAAGAAGTLSAKLRRLTTDLGALILQFPGSLGAKTGALSLSVVPNTDTPFKIAGVDADAAAPTVNPLAIAAGYTSGSLTTLSTGQLGRLNADTYRNLRVTFCALNATAADGFANANMAFAQSDALGTRTLNLFAVGGYILNGGSWDRAVKPNATGRLLSSAATTNATSVKASAGNVFKIIGNNTVASKRYLKLYNKASAPTVGTDTPVMTFVLAASAPFAIDLGASVGHYFSTGIAYAITGAAADNDTTAIASGDIECLNLTYA